MGFLKSLGPILAASARERLKQVPVRILLAGVVAWALHAAGLGGWIGPWLGLAAVVQLFEYLAMTPFRRAVPSDGKCTSPPKVFGETPILHFYVTPEG